MISILDQLVAATGSITPPEEARYQIKPGSQVDRVLQALIEAPRTYRDLVAVTGLCRGSINTAVFRLRRAGLIEVFDKEPGRTSPWVKYRVTF